MSVIEWPDPLAMYAGDTWVQLFEFGRYEGDVWVPDDLADWSDWACQWRARDTSGEAIDLQVHPESGGVLVVATPEQTRRMRRGVIDIQAVNGDVVRTFVRATIAWRNDVTRD